MAKSRVVAGGLLALAFLASCERGAASTGPACDKVAAQIITVLTKGKQDVHSMEAKSGITKRCTDDKWSAEARTCITKAQSHDELDTCKHDTLTGKQVDLLEPATRGLGSPDTQEAIRKMGEFADKMCVCKDPKCAQNVTDEMTKWGQEMAKEQDDPPKMSEEQMKQATEIGQRMGDCMVKAMGADLPTQDPTQAGDEPAPTHGVAPAGKEGDMTPDGRVIVK